MKSILLFLVIAFQAGALFAQVEQLDPNYYGEYKTDSGYEQYYFAEYGGGLDQFLTEEQQKKVAFFFLYQGTIELFDGIAMMNGNNYASHVDEDTPELTFAFTNENNLYAVVVTDKSGNKLSLTKIDYLDEENVSPVPQDEELGDVDNYDDEETTDDSAAARTYMRSDGADLAVVFTEESLKILLLIPATKSCSEVLIVGDVVRGAEEGLYVYHDPGGKFVLNLIESENTMQFQCVKGDCFDQKGTCGIWKEIFRRKN